jgi:hypothetical protein
MILLISLTLLFRILRQAGLQNYPKFMPVAIGRLKTLQTQLELHFLGM